MKGLLIRLVALILLLATIGRVNMSTGFGAGTEYAKVYVSPLSVTSALFYKIKHKVPPQIVPLGEKFLTLIAMPGEVAYENGIYNEILQSFPKKSVQFPKRSKDKMKKLAKKPMESRAKDWVKAQDKSKSMTRFLDENTFVWCGSIFMFFSAIFSLLFPFECFQNYFMGMICFWFGSTGAHGTEAQITYEFIFIFVLLALALWFLPEKDPAYEAKLKEKQKKREERRKKELNNDDWDDGIGGVTMEDIRKKTGGKPGGGCCDGH